MPKLKGRKKATKKAAETKANTQTTDTAVSGKPAASPAVNGSAVGNGVNLADLGSPEAVAHLKWREGITDSRKLVYRYAEWEGAEARGEAAGVMKATAVKNTRNILDYAHDFDADIKERLAAAEAKLAELPESRAELIASGQSFDSMSDVDEALEAAEAEYKAALKESKYMEIGLKTARGRYHLAIALAGIDRMFAASNEAKEMWQAFIAKIVRAAATRDKALKLTQEAADLSNFGRSPVVATMSPASDLGVGCHVTGGVVVDSSQLMNVFPEATLMRSPPMQDTNRIDATRDFLERELQTAMPTDHVALRSEPKATEEGEQWGK